MAIEIKSEEDFQKSIDLVSDHLQSITNYVQANKAKPPKIRFPRGYFQTVSSIKRKFSWLENSVVQGNVSYHYMYLDTIRWISNFTDIYAAPQVMIFKHAIISYATICECLIDGAAKKFNLDEKRTIPQLKKLRSLSVVTADLVLDMDWLWNLRHDLHIHLVTESESERYSVDDANRSASILSNLESQLHNHFSNN